MLTFCLITWLCTYFIETQSIIYSVYVYSLLLLNCVRVNLTAFMIHIYIYSLLGSFVPFGGSFPELSDIKFSFRGVPTSRCRICDENYEQEVLALVKGFSPQAGLPFWNRKTDLLSMSIEQDAAKVCTYKFFADVKFSDCLNQSVPFISCPIYFCMVSILVIVNMLNSM